MIDGLSRLRAHLSITVPTIRGGILSTALFVFIFMLVGILVRLGSVLHEHRDHPRQAREICHRDRGHAFGVQAALAVLAMIPLVVAGFAIQNHLARGMTFGAIKR